MINPDLAHKAWLDIWNRDRNRLLTKEIDAVSEATRNLPGIKQTLDQYDRYQNWMQEGKAKQRAYNEQKGGFHAFLNRVEDGTNLAHQALGMPIEAVSRVTNIDPRAIGAAATVAAVGKSIKFPTTISKLPVKKTIKGKSKYASDKVVDTTAYSPVKPKANIPKYAEHAPIYKISDEALGIQRTSKGLVKSMAYEAQKTWDGIGARDATNKAWRNSLVQAGDKGRTVASAVTSTNLGRSIPGSAYKKQSWMYDRVKSRLKLTGKRELIKGVVHHKGPLKRFGVGLAKHPSFTELTSGAKRSDVSIYMEKNLGIKLGNDPANLVDILETMTLGGRQERILGIMSQLGSTNIHKDTVNAILGTSGLNIPEYKTKDLALLEDWKSRFPDEPFPLKPDYGKDWHPTIPVKHPETGKVLGTVTPKTLTDRGKLWSSVAKIYKENGVNLDISKLNRKAIKISPTAEIYGKDHQTVHTLEKYFARTPGNPLYDFEAAVQDGSITEMTVPQAGQLAGQAYFLMENINKQVLAYRYNKIKEVFAAKNPELDAAYFDKLDVEVQRDFFEADINEIAVKGGLEKIITKEQALTEFKGWTPKMAKFWDFTDVVKPTKPKGRLGEVRRLDKPFEP